MKETDRRADSRGRAHRLGRRVALLWFALSWFGILDAAAQVAVCNLDASGKVIDWGKSDPSHFTLRFRYSGIDSKPDYMLFRELGPGMSMPVCPSAKPERLGERRVRSRNDCRENFVLRVPAGCVSEGRSYCLAPMPRGFNSTSLRSLVSMVDCESAMFQLDFSSVTENWRYCKESGYILQSVVRLVGIDNQWSRSGALVSAWGDIITLVGSGDLRKNEQVKVCFFPYGDCRRHANARVHWIERSDREWRFAVLRIAGGVGAQGSAELVESYQHAHLEKSRERPPDGDWKVVGVKPGEGRTYVWDVRDLGWKEVQLVEDRADCSSPGCYAFFSQEVFPREYVGGPLVDASGRIWALYAGPLSGRSDQSVRPITAEVVAEVNSRRGGQKNRLGRDEAHGNR